VRKYFSGGTRSLPEKAGQASKFESRQHNNCSEKERKVKKQLRAKKGQVGRVCISNSGAKTENRGILIKKKRADRHNHNGGQGGFKRGTW